MDEEPRWYFYLDEQGRTEWTETPPCYLPNKKLLAWKCAKEKPMDKVLKQ